MIVNDDNPEVSSSSSELKDVQFKHFLQPFFSRKSLEISRSQSQPQIGCFLEREYFGGVTMHSVSSCVNVISPFMLFYSYCLSTEAHPSLPKKTCKIHYVIGNMSFFQLLPHSSSRKLKFNLSADGAEVCADFFLLTEVT